jgi:hypothetical protein
MGVGGQRHGPPALPPGKTRYSFPFSSSSQFKNVWSFIFITARHVTAYTHKLSGKCYFTRCY